MTFVIDASAAVRLLTLGSMDRILDKRSAGTLMYAPVHFDIECLSALRKLWMRGLLDAPSLEAFSRVVIHLPAQRVGTQAFTARIVELRHNATPYDAAYVALAEGLEGVLVSDDDRMARIPGIGCRVIQSAEFVR